MAGRCAHRAFLATSPVTVSPVLAVTLRYALIPVVFTIVGATAGVYWPAVARLRSHVLHLAAGVVFSVVAVELLPEIQRRALVWDVIWGFGAGVAAMLLVDKLLDRIRGEDEGDVPGPKASEIVLSFGAAALLYLVTAELLREAHEERESASATALFFVGFLAFLVVGMTLG